MWVFNLGGMGKREDVGILLLYTPVVHQILLSASSNISDVEAFLLALFFPQLIIHWSFAVVAAGRGMLAAFEGGGGRWKHTLGCHKCKWLCPFRYLLGGGRSKCHSIHGGQQGLRCLSTPWRSVHYLPAVWRQPVLTVLLSCLSISVGKVLSCSMFLSSK